MYLNFYVRSEPHPFVISLEWYFNMLKGLGNECMEISFDASDFSPALSQQSGVELYSHTNRLQFRAEL
jgi:hypothetical protein